MRFSLFIASAITLAAVLLSPVFTALPAQAQAIYVPNFGSGPRIIHVKPSLGNARASVPPEELEHDELSATLEDDELAAPPPRRRLTPPRRYDIAPALPRRKPPSSNNTAVPGGIDLPPPPVVDIPAEFTPPPTAPRRSLLSAPPLSAEGPSPIKPTPRWRTGGRVDPPADAAPIEVEKFVAPTVSIPVDVPLPRAAPQPPTSEDLPPE